MPSWEEKSPKPFEKFVISSPEVKVFPIFSTKVVKNIAKPLFFLNITGDTGSFQALQPLAS